MLKKIFFLLLFCLTLSPTAQSEELRFNKLNIPQLKQIYDIYDYHGEKDYLMIPGYKYPAIFLSRFPTDYNQITDEKERNALFIKILAPLALKINQDIAKERQELQTLHNKYQNTGKLNSKDNKKLENFAKKYDVFTRLKKDERLKFLFRELFSKIEFIPPSLLITAAAIDTNWGTSRIVKEGNTLYKKIVWHTDKGLKPIGEKEDASYRIKTYPNILESMQEYALTINSEYKYTDLRDMRREFLYRDNIPFGNILAPYLIWHSPLENYAGMFQYTLAYYELSIIDKSSLDNSLDSQKLPAKLKKLIVK